MAKKKITFNKQLIIPLVAILALIIINLIFKPSFFSIKYGTDASNNPILSGNLITILDSGSELAILAIGMTLVTAASGGQDISVGATISIAGAIIMRILCGMDANPTELHAPIIVAFLIACVAAMACGAFNGIIVAYFKIQPMIATLILFTAGRSIASWIGHNNNYNLGPNCSKEFGYIGGCIPGIPIPTPFFIAVICTLVIMLVLKFTTLGLYTQAVGINESSSKLNGLNPKLIKLITFVILGLCVAIAGFIKVSRSRAIGYSTTAKDIEMDAILAVALGGNALGGGKFSMMASILGAYVIQFLTTTLYAFKVKSEALSAYKAVVVIILVVLSAPTVRKYLTKLWKYITSSKKTKKEVA